ncbi:MAG: helix-turn-helix transcriptional regulator [Bacteroidota bacterium]
MSQKSIGEFEEIILLIVAILNGKAYSVNIIEEIAERLDRKASLGAVQTVLKRLEHKGLLNSDFGDATKVRGGKRKRLYQITTEGQQALAKTRTQRNSLWEAIPNLSFKLI